MTFVSSSVEVDEEEGEDEGEKRIKRKTSFDIQPDDGGDGGGTGRKHGSLSSTTTDAAPNCSLKSSWALEDVANKHRIIDDVVGCHAMMNRMRIVVHCPSMWPSIASVHTRDDRLHRLLSMVRLRVVAVELVAVVDADDDDGCKQAENHCH